MENKTNDQDHCMKTTDQTINGIHIRINSYFDQSNKIENILYSLANLKLKEKSA